MVLFVKSSQTKHRFRSVMGTGSLMSYTNWQTVNDARVGHDFLGFIVLKRREKCLKFASGV